MKRVKSLLLTAVLLSAVGCAPAKLESAKPAPEEPKTAEQSTEAAAATTAPAAGSQPVQQQAAPDALIKDLYKVHAQGDGKILNGKSRAMIDKYFDKNLANLIWKDLTTNRDEIGVIDFDLFYNTQDPMIKNLQVGAGKIAGENATVPVTFSNSGRKETINYQLVRQNNAWKISDIKYQDGSLLKYFKDAAADEGGSSAVTDGNFEGTYRVGDTTCTVKPIKMAFEVRWQKGAGSETFFYQDRANDKIIFATDPPDGKKANIFSFDDESYATGTFYRADGKEFAISKIK